jgi:hypothetical protein
VCGTTTRVVEKRSAEVPSGQGSTVATVEDEFCEECLRRWWAAAGATVEATR